MTILLMSFIPGNWKAFYEEWSKPGTENTIRYTNLAPGKYTLRVRAISNEDQRIMLEERSIDIIIAQPFWLTVWAMLLYIVILCLYRCCLITYSDPKETT